MVDLGIYPAVQICHFDLWFDSTSGTEGNLGATGSSSLRIIR